MRGPTPLLIAALLMLGGCSYGVTVDAYPTEPHTTQNCDAVYADLPGTVAGADRKTVDTTNAAVWGDPQIILRCGVEKPEALTRSSRCATIDGVDWFSEETADGFLFTTVGRGFFISVEVPADYQPAADALVDLGDSVAKHDPSIQPCV